MMLKRKSLVFVTALLAISIVAFTVLKLMEKKDGRGSPLIEPDSFLSTAAESESFYSEINESESQSESEEGPSEGTTSGPFKNTWEPEIIDLGFTDSDVVLAFTGDINLDGEWENSPMKRFKVGQDKITDFIDPVLVEKMKKADILVVNNEFAFSNRGEKQNKNYTFRADPKNVFVYKELGVDLATLANNHIYDYKSDALADTISTLESAGIAAIGAGKNIEEAKRAAYFRINGKVYAFVSAGRAEAWFKTPVAWKNSPGILDAYGSDNCLKSIKEAKKHSDYVFLCVHWGNEGSHQAASEQLTNGKLYIDAGADAVIGCHPHLLQGMEFYKGRFIAYSLGNFWFNMKSLESGLLELHISPDGTIKPTFTPAFTKEGKTMVEGNPERARETFDLIESVSPGKRIKIDDRGRISEK